MTKKHLILSTLPAAVLALGLASGTTQAATEYLYGSSGGLANELTIDGSTVLSTIGTIAGSGAIAALVQRIAGGIQVHRDLVAVDVQVDS